MVYQILNNLGEVEVESVTEEELSVLKENALAGGFNYYEFDYGNDLVASWAQDTEVDYSRSKIFKKIN